MPERAPLGQARTNRRDQSVAVRRVRLPVVSGNEHSEIRQPYHRALSNEHVRQTDQSNRQHGKSIIPSKYIHKYANTSMTSTIWSFACLDRLAGLDRESASQRNTRHVAESGDSGERTRVLVYVAKGIYSYYNYTATNCHTNNEKPNKKHTHIESLRGRVQGDRVGQIDAAKHQDVYRGRIRRLHERQIQGIIQQKNYFINPNVYIRKYRNNCI